MIGVNTSIFKSAGRKLVNLLGALKDRATYYENSTDSVAEKNRIDDLGVLDKATILLTPTATSDALVHSVKTYTGDELVTNGTFDTETDWTFSNITFSSGAILFDSATDNVFQNFSDTINTRYKITVTKTGEGTLRYRTGYAGSDNLKRDIPESGIVYFTSTSDTNRIQIYGDVSSVNATLNSVSVVEVASDFASDRASSATRINSSGLVQDMQSITDPELVLNGDFEELGDELVTNGGFDTDSDWTFLDDSWQIIDGKLILTDTSTTNVNQAIGLVQNKFYKIVFTIANTTLGGVRVRLGTGAITSEFTNGTHTIYLEQTTTNDAFRLYASTSGVFNGSIDNVSVKQLNVDSEGNDIWTLGTGWSIEDGKLVGTSVSTQFAQQSFTFIDGNTYKITFDITGADTLINDTSFRLPYDGTLGNIRYLEKDSPDGTYSHTFVAGTSPTLYLGYIDNGTYTGTIDNISVKDVTFSTDVDLARINYDSNGENGHILLEPTSTNLVTYSEDIDSLNDGEGEVGVNSTLTYESDVVAPDGSLGVYRIQNPATASTYLQVTNNTTAAQSMSVWVKAKTVGTNNQFTLYRDGTGGSASDVKTATGDWQRFEYSWSTVGSGAYFINNDGDTYTSDLYVWGIQVENLPYATSYIPTLTGSTVTRAAETLVDSGNTTLINTDQGVFYAEIARTSNNADFELISLLQDSDTSTKIAIGFYESNNNFFIRTYYNGSDVYPIYDDIAPNLNQFYKVAVKYNRNGINNVWIDGVKVVSDVTLNVSAPTNPLTHLKFDWNPANTQFPFHGKCKALAVFNEAIEDDELELLTGVTNYGSFSGLASANGYTII